jgi:hypothetical protein
MVDKIPTTSVYFLHRAVSRLMDVADDIGQ